MKIDFQRGVAISSVGRVRGEHAEGRIFHTCFLLPLSLLLRRYRRSLLHAAFVVPPGEERGALIVGHPGAGKSGISAVALMQGFAFFGDEHVVMSWTEQSDHPVTMLSFVNELGIRPAAIEYFSSLKPSARWVETRKKYYVSPQSISALAANAATGAAPKPPSERDRAEVGVIVFPSFVAGSPLTPTPIRLSHEASLEHLVQDEYCVLAARTSEELALKKEHFNALLGLALKVPAYRIEYDLQSLASIPGLLARLVRGPHS
jgi:hypothetical protein